MKPEFLFLEKIPDGATIEDLKFAFMEVFNTFEGCVTDYYNKQSNWGTSEWYKKEWAEWYVKALLFSAWLRDRDMAGPQGRSLEEIKSMVMSQGNDDLKSYMEWDKKRARIVEGRYPAKGEDVLQKPTKTILAKDLVKPAKTTSGQRVRVVVTGFETHDLIMTDAESITFLEQLNARKEAQLKSLGWEWKWKHGRLDVKAGDRQNEPDKISVKISKYTDWV